MIEYLYDAIRATAGEDIVITARITEPDGSAYTTGAHLNLYDDENTMATLEGTYSGDVWSFTIPADLTKGLAGRYWYCICNPSHTKMQFKAPLYLV